MKKLSFSNRGFSLVELVIAVLVFGVISVFLVRTYTGNSKIVSKQKTEVYLETVYNNLKSNIINPEVIAYSATQSQPAFDVYQEVEATKTPGASGKDKNHKNGHEKEEYVYTSEPVTFKDCVIENSDNDCKIFENSKPVSFMLYKPVPKSSAPKPIAGTLNPYKPVYYTSTGTLCGTTKTSSDCVIAAFAEVKGVTCSNSSPPPCDGAGTSMGFYLTLKEDNLTNSTKEKKESKEVNQIFNIRSNKDSSGKDEYVDFPYYVNTCDIVLEMAKSISCPGKQCDSIKAQVAKCQQGIIQMPTPPPTPTPEPTVEPTNTPVGPTPIPTVNPTPTDMPVLPVVIYTPIIVTPAPNVEVSVFDQVSDNYARADLLFVIDITSSMGNDQKNLANGFSSFTNAMANSGLSDYQLGVTSTNIGSDGKKKPEQFALMGHLRNGAVYNSSSIESFKSAVFMGDDGGHQEHGLYAFKYAADYLLTSGSDINKLVRRDSNLNVIFVTDDQAQNIKNGDNINSYAQNLLAYAKTNLLSRNTSIRFHGILDPQRSTGYIALINLTGGVYGNVNNVSSWSNLLTNIAKNANVIKSEFPLEPSFEPDMASLEIKIDEIVIPPTHYTFDPVTKVITFKPEFIPGKGKRIFVRYGRKN